MILISYPSGGYGNFLYHVLTEFSSNTYKPANQNFSFDSEGRSHSTKKYTPVYFHDPDNYKLMLPNTDLECLVLCDNGITNDSYTKINQTFPGATIVRSVVTDSVRPIIYKTCITKAKRGDTVSETIDHVAEHWTDQEDYSIRENFTLLYHNWPFKWQADAQCINVELEALITQPVDTIVKLIEQIGGTVVDQELLAEVCRQWTNSNYIHFKVYYDWQKIEQALDSHKHIDISDIVDLHDQGYINYCLEKKFNYVIPVYDYRNWFKNTQDIPLVI